MAELTTGQLIKIILGALVFVAVVIGLFLFFKGSVIDFFKGVVGGEEPEENGEIPQEGGEEDEEQIGEPSRLCEDCKAGFFDTCSEEECKEINDELLVFKKKCEFTPKTWFGGVNKCVTINI